MWLSRDQIYSKSCAIFTTTIYRFWNGKNTTYIAKVTGISQYTELMASIRNVQRQSQESINSFSSGINSNLEKYNY